MTNSESQRYQYPVCHTVVATHHPLSRFQSSARGPGLSLTRSVAASTLLLGLLSSKTKILLSYVEISWIKLLLLLHQSPSNHQQFR